MRFGWILALVLPMPGVAEVLTVRGGEHDNFTRLVVPIERSADWNLTQTGRVSELSVEGVTFDTTQTFLRIGRDRVSSVAATDEKLTIELSCNCAVSTLVVDGYLALDISDAISSEILPVITPRIYISDYSFANFQANSMEVILSRRIAKAAGEGLLEVSDGIESGIIAEAIGYDGLLVHSDLDASLAGDAERQNECPAEEWLNPSVWKMSGDFPNDLKLYRAKITDELGVLSDAEIISLARTYFYYGLFDETSRTIAMSSRPLPELEVLGDAVIQNLAEVGDCGEHIALWAYLSGSEADISSVQRGFMQLPATIRNQIGGDFIAKLLHEGEVDVAWSMSDYLAVGSEDYQLSKARILAFEESWEESAGLYVEIFHNRPSSSSIALELIDVADLGALSLSNDVPELIVSAFGLSADVPGEAVGPLAMVAARSGDFDLSAELAKILGQDHLDRQILDIAAATASDVVVLRLAFGVFPEHVVLENTAFMERLSALGFNGSIPEPSAMTLVATSDSAPVAVSLRGSREQLERSSETRRQVEAALRGNGL